MKTQMRTIVRMSLAILILGCFLAVPAFSAPGMSMEEQMHMAAAKAGVRIQTEEMVVLSRDRATFAVAVIDGFEHVPATSLPKGVDFGFAFIDAPQSGIETGYYTLRATAPDPQLGENEATVQLIDRFGRAVSEQPSVIDVFSMELPDDPAAERSVVGASLETNEAFRLIRIEIYIYCPNGVIICFALHIDPFWSWL